MEEEEESMEFGGLNLQLKFFFDGETGKVKAEEEESFYKRKDPMTLHDNFDVGETGFIRTWTIFSIFIFFRNLNTLFTSLFTPFLVCKRDFTNPWRFIL